MFEHKPTRAICALVGLLVAIIALRRAPAMTYELTGKMGFSILSNDFREGADIPQRFTCEGVDSSPELSWTDPPAGTRSLALIMQDPDAPGGTFTHWLLFDLPPDARKLEANVSKVDELPNGARQGKNGFRKIGYGGPCPPPGKPHRYFFKLHALDKRLDLGSAASKDDLERAMQGHTLGKTEIMGKYAR